MLYQLIASGEFSLNYLPESSFKEKWGKPLSAKVLNILLMDHPHKCSYCGYSFSIMPDFEEGKAYYIKHVTCSKCGNVDEVNRFYEV